MGIKAWPKAEENPLAAFHQFEEFSMMDETPTTPSFYDELRPNVDKFYDPISLTASAISQATTRRRLSEWESLVSEAVNDQVATRTTVAKPVAVRPPDRYREIKWQPEPRPAFSWLRGRTAALVTAVLATTGAIAHTSISAPNKPQRSYSVEDIVPITNADSARLNR